MNTVCLPADKIPTECPMVDIQFLIGTEGYENYIKTDYADLTLAYTKDQLDGSPITSTRVGPYACLDPKEYDGGETTHSPIEKDIDK